MVIRGQLSVLTVHCTQADHFSCKTAIKAHLVYFLTRPFLHFQKIYIMRNPKDVIVSQFFLTKSLMQVPQEYDLQMFIGDWLAEQSKFIVHFHS